MGKEKKKNERENRDRKCPLKVRGGGDRRINGKRGERKKGKVHYRRGEIGK